VSAAQALVLVVALAVAAAIVGPMLRALSAAGLERENYRGRRLPVAAGAVIVAAAAVALVPLAALDELAGVHAFRPELRVAAIYVVGVAFLGLLDDAMAGEPRGWRGHGAAVLRGGVSSGALKAAGSLGLAMFALADQDLGAGRYLLGVGVLVLATNLFNLLDLRPGRAVKALAILGAGLTLGAMDLHPLAALGLFAAPLLVLGFYDLRELAMLGDTGSNLAGGLAGGWLILTLDQTGLAVALALLVLVTAYGEFRSISALIDRFGPLRWLDALGRARA
jgi:UDP-GlcNAc:undecaprenyl-phosphate/decaprenyl-phosphate GlcNAc-1-phosphate transferase